MSGERLRAELQRIAEGAPEVAVPDDLFTRGRRATARARMLAAAAAVGCVALLAAVVVPVLTRDDAPPVAAGGAAVPDRIHAIPADIGREELADTGVRRAAAVVVSDAGIVVLVDAETGGYHPVALPGLLSGPDNPTSLSFTDPPVALSPDGRLLAWEWITGTTEHTVHAGVQIADLATGKVRKIRLTKGDRSILIDGLHWSANGRWLAWTGYPVLTWTPNETANGQRPVAGALSATGEPGATLDLPQPEVRSNGASSTGDEPDPVAVSDTGELVAVSGNALVTATGTKRFPMALEGTVTGLRVEGDRVVALLQEPSGSTLRLLPSGAAAASLDGLPGHRGIQYVGALGERLLLRTWPGADTDGSSTVYLTDPARPGEASGTLRVDPGIRSFTLALDLMTPDRLTVTRPAPDWPWWTSERRELALYLGGAAVGLLALAWWTWRKQRRWDAAQRRAR